MEPAKVLKELRTSLITVVPHLQKVDQVKSFFLILVSISFDNYRKIHPGILESDSTSSDDDLDYDEDDVDKTKQSGKKN
jgi:hypothetical protein